MKFYFRVCRSLVIVSTLVILGWILAGEISEISWHLSGGMKNNSIPLIILGSLMQACMYGLIASIPSFSCAYLFSNFKESINFSLKIFTGVMALTIFLFIINSLHLDSKWKKAQSYLPEKATINIVPDAASKAIHNILQVSMLNPNGDFYEVVMERGLPKLSKTIELDMAAALYFSLLLVFIFILFIAKPNLKYEGFRLMIKILPLFALIFASEFIFTTLFPTFLSDNLIFKSFNIELQITYISLFFSVFNWMLVLSLFWVLTKRKKVRSFNLI